MKKSFSLLALVAVVAGVIALAGLGDELKARSSGTLYGDALVIGYPGTAVAAISDAGVLSVAGLTNVGALANTGAVSNIGAVSVSTSATSSVSLIFKGATVTLSTKSVTMGEIWYQTSDNKVYVATRTWGENVSTCAGTACYSAFN